jgi:hypothetical protein
MRMSDTIVRRVARITAATAVALVVSVAWLPPASAQVRVTAGSGVIVAAITYSSPGIPGDLVSCATTGWSLASAPQAPSAGASVDLAGGFYAGGTTFNGTDQATCESASAGSGAVSSLVVADGAQGIVSNSTMSCRLGSSYNASGNPAGGVWLRNGALLSMVVWGDCHVGGVDDGTTYFTITGAWVPTITSAGADVVQATLIGAWSAG